MRCAVQLEAVGPLWGASLVTAVFTLRERIGALAARRMNLALLAAVLAAGAFVAVACIRSANRQFHLIHPELHLEESTSVLGVWTTIVAGVIGAGWHFLGWALVLLGSTGWTSRRLPRVLSVLCLVAGAVSLLEYQLPELEPTASPFPPDRSPQRSVRVPLPQPAVPSLRPIFEGSSGPEPPETR
jgi:hypothetical protein